MTRRPLTAAELAMMARHRAYYAHLLAAELAACERQLARLGDPS